MRQSLYLQEEYLLFALSGKTGRSESARKLEVPLAIAIIAELLLQKHIALEREKKKKILV